MGSGGSRPSGRPRSVDRTTYYDRHRGVRNNNNRNTDINGRPRPHTEAPEELLKVSNVDLNVLNNTRDHRTNQFDAVTSRGELILRRGQVFMIDVEFNRPYESKDDLRLVFKFGQRPNESKGTLVEFILSDKDVKNSWGAFVKSNEGNTLRLGVVSPATCLVGKWSLQIDVIKRADRSYTRFRYSQTAPIYFLFNPWCKDDMVFMKEEKLLDEYIMCESGFIYAGTERRISGKPWVFGQFEGKVFDCVMYLLEISGLQDHLRGYPVLVARKLSAVVNSPDDNGVLVGRWSGDYSGGTSPLKWTGSEAILEEFLKTKRSVQYGQCWVFSGLLTTVCRALGIPARSTTNFQSAHDTDGSITIDTYFDEAGNPIDSSDSVWNFHVWNDVWMARPDLPPGYGGWQAIDATPQETSEGSDKNVKIEHNNRAMIERHLLQFYRNDQGFYQMGPVSLLALKRGEVNFPYDGPFAFAEVNADRIFWNRYADNSEEVINVRRRDVGKKISTKKPFSSAREDITNQYKFDEGTDEERAAVYRAQEFSSGIAKEVYETKEKDVHFEIIKNDDTFMGDTIKFSMTIKNNSNERRTVWGNLTLFSSHYTGVRLENINKHCFDRTDLEAKEEKVIDVEVGVMKYLDKLTDHCICMISCMCIVEETRQTFADMEELRLRKPHLKIKAPKTGKVGENFEVEVSFDNPLPVTLTDCELRVEAPGIQQPAIYKQPNVNSRQTFTGKFEMCPFKPGDREIIVYFNCTQILSVNISHNISIK